MRIGWLAFESVNARYRGYVPARELHERGHDVLYLAETDVPRDLSKLLDRDVVVMYRHFDATAVRAATYLRENGVALVWDNDDLLTGITKGHSEYRNLGGLRGERILKHIRAMVGLADVVTTPSAGLAEHYRAYGARFVAVIENYLPHEFLVSRQRDPRDTTVVCWTAAREHRLDLEQLNLSGRLLSLLEREPGLEFASIGLNLGFAHARYRHIRSVDFAKLTEALSAFDIGIAPLAATEFNASKSNVKVKEYAAGGLPWLASDFGPYAGLGPSEGGALVSDSGWEEAIVELARDGRLRAKRTKKAVRFARDQSISNQVKRWERVLSQARESTLAPVHS
ncbi:MAG TPA: hypothetical protein VGM91_00640 [Conexibacter sp.]|jgi:glycosyltransferase involved in cell wall biosynthesis